MQQTAQIDDLIPSGVSLRRIGNTVEIAVGEDIWMVRPGTRLRRGVGVPSAVVEVQCEHRGDLSGEVSLDDVPPEILPLVEHAMRLVVV